MNVTRAVAAPTDVVETGVEILSDKRLRAQGSQARQQRHHRRADHDTLMVTIPQNGLAHLLKTALYRV
jgi:hypothetical protein